MKSDNPISTISVSPRPSTYSIYKRIANLALVIMGATICVNLWLLSADQAQNWHDKQANQLARSLSLQGANMLKVPLGNNDVSAIKQRLIDLGEDPHVSGAAVFGRQGQIIENLNGNVSVLADFRLQQEKPLVFIREIVVDGQIIGYLRLLLDEEQVMVYHSDYQRQIYEQLLVLMMLAGAVGLLICRAFYKFRYRHYIKPDSSQTTE